MEPRQKESPPEREGDKMELTINSNDLNKDISFYANVQAKKTQTTNILAVLEGVKNGTYKAGVTAYRDALLLGLDNAGEIKKALAGVTFAGTFTPKGRKPENLIKWNGLITLDFDHVSDPEKLKAEAAKIPHTVAAFISPSDDGVKVVVAVDCAPEDYTGCFDALGNGLYNLEGFDNQTSDLNRLCFVSYDPDIFINPHAQPFHYSGAMSTTPAIKKQEPAENYEAVFQKMLTRECKAVDLSDGKWNAGVYFLAARANDYCIPLNTAKTLIWAYADRDGTGHEQAMATIESAYKNNDSELKSYTEKQTLIPALFADIINRAESWGFRLNLLTNKIEKGDGQEMTEVDLNTFYIECSANKRVSREKVWQALNSQYLPSYHPFTEYLQYLETIPESEYSGTLDDFVGCFQLNEEYHPNPNAFKEQLLKKWLGGIIGSMAGSYSVTALILVGGQKTYKSTVLRELLPEPLRRYFAPARVKAHPDFYQIACSNILACDDEFTGYSKLEAETLKMIASSEFFEYRAPYARTVEKRKRTAVFCGTSNNAAAISDVTGNRRVIVCNVKSIDYPWMKGIDRNLLFAELYALFRQNATWWHLGDADIQLLADENELNTSNPVLELVERLTEALAETEKGGITSMDVMEHILTQYPNQKGVNTIAVGQCLTRLYGPPKTTRFGQKTVKAYRCKKLYKYGECGDVVGDVVRTFEKLPHPETRTT